MAEQKRPPEGWDGRFGDTFDDEINVKSMVQIAIGLAVLSVLGIVLAWGSLKFVESLRDAPVSSPVAADEAPRSSGPLLQPHPEAEMAALWNEMAFRLGAPVGPKKPPADSGAGWGWVDEAAGVIHIPIYQAFDLLLEQSSQPRLEPALSTLGEAHSEIDTEPPAENDAHE